MKSLPIAIITIAVLFLTWLPPTFAQTTQSNSINQEMLSAAYKTDKIYRFVQSDTHLLSKGDKTVLQRDIGEIRQHIQNALRDNKGQPTTFVLSYKTIIDHFDRIDTALASDNTIFAKSLLGGTVSICSDCHRQDKKIRHLHRQNLADSLATPLQQADFYYMTRNYDAALVLYADYLRTRVALEKNPLTSTSLERLLIIWIQIKGDINGAVDYITAIGNQSVTSRAVKVDINAWLKGLSEISALKKTINVSDPKAVEELLYQYVINRKDPDSYRALEEENRVIAIWLQGLVHEHLRGDPQKALLPKALFWLAIIDRALEYDLRYSIADLYLKECIQSHTRHPYASHCYKLYENYAAFSYRNTSLPKELKEELGNLERLLNPGKL